MKARGDGKAVHRVAISLGAALLFLAGAYGAADAVLADPPTASGFGDTVLASRAVVAAVRIAVLAAAGYVVASVIALIRRGQFLTRVGPLEASDHVLALKAQIADLSAEVDRYDAEVEDLRQESGNMRNVLSAIMLALKETGP